jgi:hypothetical protein
MRVLPLGSGAAHNGPVSNLNAEAAPNSTLAAQGMNRSVFNDCFYIQGRDALTQFYSMGSTTKVKLLDIQGKTDCQQPLGNKVMRDGGFAANSTRHLGIHRVLRVDRFAN